MPRQADKVGKYTIVRKIAKGGMGAVFLARHPTLKRHVILKKLTLRGGGGFITRFKREASLMIDFRTEHIVPVYDHFRVGSAYYIVMEYVDGTSLDQLIEEREGLSNEAALLIFNEICKGLKYAHDKDVIHRDIKPANILISKEGEVKLTDFGIATSKEADEEVLTKVGTTLGTPAYMSPEQISDTSKVDKRADIYSLGVMFYEMLTGKKPFPPHFTPEAIDQISRGIYVKPKKINPTIPISFMRIIKRTMNRKINKRYRDIQYILNILSKYTKKYKSQKAVNADIKKYLQGADITIPTIMKIGKKRYKRGGILLGITAALAAITVFFIGGIYCYYKGYYHEYFKSREYGKLEITASIPKEYFKEPRLIYAYALLKAQDTATAEDEANKTEYQFRLSPVRKRAIIPALKKDEERTQDQKLLTTSELYLPGGSYDLELYMENRKYYKSFYLNPRVIQRQDPDTNSGRLVQFDFEKSFPKQIDLVHKITDSETGRSIYGKTDISFYLEDQDRWIDWKRYNENLRLKRYLMSKITSGQWYRFRYSAPQYYDATVRFYVESNLDSAQIEVALIRKPGTLIISSNHEGLDILIDDRKENYIGEREMMFTAYGKTVKGEKQFMLSEGTHVATLKRGNRNIEDAQFRILPDATTRIEVSYNVDEKKIKLNVKNPRAAYPQ
jgi:hypothetical protein